MYGRFIVPGILYFFVTLFFLASTLLTFGGHGAFTPGACAPFATPTIFVVAGAAGDPAAKPTHLTRD